MDHVFDSVGDVKIGRDSWRLRVRVLRLWRVPSFKNPEQAISLEMVLVDEKLGVKIHATIKKQLLYLFQDKIVEGEVYKMTNFEVAGNTGSYRTVVHEFKLNFLMRTKVQRAGGSVISQNGLSFSKCSEIKSVKEEAVHLVGLLSGVSAEKEYIRDGKIVKMVIIEITDDRLAVHGVESTCPIAVIQPRARISKEDDFLRMYPKKSIDGVKHSFEEGNQD